jgi:GNAT superfamily N-acetyltransferase
MITILRTTSDDVRFRSLVDELDRELAVYNGENNAFFAQFNTIDVIKHVVLAVENSASAGCGAIKEYAPDTMEVKRMFVQSHLRSRGIASLVLVELEKWCREMGYRKCILETSKALTAAVRLYEQSGYRRIPNYGQYVPIETSICFEKLL